jgi:hypothetical protein
VALFLEQVLNQPCSPAWVVKLQDQATAALRPSYDEAAARLRTEPVLGIDEWPTKEGRHATVSCSPPWRNSSLIRQPRERDAPCHHAGRAGRHTFRAERGSATFLDPPAQASRSCSTLPAMSVSRKSRP